jgi:hypothetical protein
MSQYINEQEAITLKEEVPVKLSSNPSWTYSLEQSKGSVKSGQIVGNIVTKTPETSVLFKHFPPVRPNTPNFDNSC